MSDIGELKAFGVAHAHSQRIPIARYEEVCGRVVSDGDGTPGSWVAEWTREGDRLAERGRTLEASGHYNLARFPYVDNDARRDALAKAVASCDRWAAGEPELEPLELDFMDGRLRCWAGGLSADRPRPLLIVMGGIVTIKEQWAPLLTRLRRLGLAGVVAEMPGVGENTARYGPESWRMLPAILDAVAGRADVEHTYAMALSFSGHLALRAAAHDPRIKGVVTVGAPVAEFFTDPAWTAGLPTVTAETLADLTGVPVEKLPDELRDGWALTADELASVEVPVWYVSSTRDEVIPPGEAALLRAKVRDLRLLEYDEEHAAPRYAAETRAWVMLAILHMSGAKPPQRAALAGAWRALRARRWLIERGGRTR